MIICSIISVIIILQILALRHHWPVVEILGMCVINFQCVITFAGMCPVLLRGEG